MIVTRIQLFCDDTRHKLRIYFPEEGPADGAIYTFTDLRAAASKHGWGRARQPSRDLCPICWAKHLDNPKSR